MVGANGWATVGPISKTTLVQRWRATSQRNYIHWPNIIDSYVPMKKQGKRSKKKHLSKEAFRKMRYKQNMWRVYKHTGKDEDYEVYKEALNAATNEVRKAKRNFEHKLAQNIKSDSKSFYAYVRSKQLFEIRLDRWRTMLEI